jgi:hypothetical protein
MNLVSLSLLRAVSAEGYHSRVRDRQGRVIRSLKRIADRAVFASELAHLDEPVLEELQTESRATCP